MGCVLAIMPAWLASAQESPKDPSAAAVVNVETEPPVGDQAAKPQPGEEKPATPGAVPGPDDQTRITQIFEAYIEALGGEQALSKLQSRVTFGTIESRGRKVEFETHQAADGRFALIQHHPGETFRLSHDGTNTWTQTGQETWELLPEADALVERVDNNLLAPLRWREDFRQRKLLPVQTIGGRRLDVIEVTYATGKTRRLFFDQRTHRLVRTEHDSISSSGEPVATHVTAKEFRAVDGLVIPYTTESWMGSRRLISSVSNVVHDDPIDLNLFSPPVGNTKGSGFRDSERYFEKLTIGELTYKNVWVHRQTNFNVLIRHAGGIQTIKLTDLPKTDLDALRPQLGDLARIDNEGGLKALGKVTEFELGDEARETLNQHLGQLQALLRLILVPLIVVLVLGHVLFSF
ncbi:MAG TPA: hypothetical protein DCY13_16955, partial [Verrucomicrobiales bacterium]|nr:hypothetical protein [Verrucomicrobiales bacterium]